MEIFIELNQKYGKGYQVRLTHGPIDKKMDEQPFTMYEAVQGARTALEIISKDLGTTYGIQEVLRIDSQGVETNQGLDIASAKFFKDMKQGGGEYLVPKRSDFIRGQVDGEEEILITGRGVILFTWFAWKDEKNQIARNALRRYCNLLAIRGYGKGASEILEDLLIMDKKSGTEWVKKTYAKYIRDDSEAIGVLQG